MESKIAIIGLGALFPGARDVAEFWQNILSKKVSIGPLPEEIFESQVYYRPDLISAFDKEDKSVTKIAGWIENLNFDSVKKYKIPPSVAEHMDTNQHAALYTTGQALEMNSLQDVARDRVAVIFGNGMVGTRYGDAMFRVQFQLVEHYLRQHPAFQNLAVKDQNQLIEYMRANVLKDTIPITEDSAPGVLPNLIAGRIANVYDFHGPSFTVDAACASVLAAVITGIQGLQLKQYDAVICGGSDMPLKQLGFVLFSALNALSPDGSYPFDQRANGFVMGQGAGTVILKRLEDAIQNQDTIYAVITGHGEASDGKGKYIAAPNADWQARAIENACRMAGYPVDTIELMEAHGTATKVGDVVEVLGLKQAFNRLGAQRTNYCGLTSVKSNIGHLKSAAGIAGLLKAALAIHHHQLPPTANFTSLNPKLELEGSPFYILDELREWESQKAYPRRANVSSFGFGGADYHLALEEYRPADYPTPIYKGYTAQTNSAQPAPDSLAAGAAMQSDSAELPELVFFAAPTVDDLKVQIEAFLTRMDTGGLSFNELCSLQNYSVRPSSGTRLAVLAASPAELASKIDLFTQRLDDSNSDLLKTKGIYFKQGSPIQPDQTALLFPGQASQYPNMLQGAFQTYDLLRTWLRKADAYWYSRHAETISSFIFPTGSSEGEAAERLRQTQFAHPSIFITSYALFDLLQKTGLQASYTMGHSLGEITALAAAGKVDFDDALMLVEQRGMAFADENLPDPGQMLSLKGSQSDAERLILASGCMVTVANLNSPSQTIIAGSSPEIQRFKRYLDDGKVTNKLLYVSHAFHSDMLQPVAERFYRRIQEIPFKISPVQVMMNHTGSFYPDDLQGLKALPELLREQILKPVNFMAGVQQLHQEGVRLFVELGPGSVLSSLVKDILNDQDIRVLTANFKNADDLTSLQKLYGALFAEGVPVQPQAVRTAVATVLNVDVGISQPEPPAEKTSPTVTVVPTPPVDLKKIRVVYSGAAIGLPGSYKDTFRDDNFEQLFAGHNLIERLTDAERQSLVDLNITKLVKDESGPTFKLLTSLDEVIQLAGKIGRIDLIRDYHIDERLVQNMTSCIANGVAAGYEALKDARIPLIREYSQTTTGKWLPQKLALPPAMQDETGVIFANGFPLIDPVIEEVSRFISYTYGSKTRKELMAFYESIISRVKDDGTRKLLSDWYTLYYSRLSDQPGQAEVYRFNHHFMTRISAQANNLLAYLLNARGPNFQLNAACSSTSNAITIAEDFIRSGRVQRMIVVGADDPSSRTNLAILGAGFLSTGAATNEGDLYKAAIPFDGRRNGMIMGAGAVGIILETQAAVEQRGIHPICELVGTHSFNTAKHISQIDADSFSVELDRFLIRVEQENNLPRTGLASQMVYLSHETYTPPRGGCSQTEAQALRYAFGEDFRKLIVGNTKGMTGHTMGASLEDAIAAKSLQYGKLPPVVNYAQPDPQLEGLQLWKGGSHNRSFALKMSAGFGAQGHFALLRKSCTGEDRMADPARYQAWLRQAANDPNAATELIGRLLVVKDTQGTARDHTAPAQGSSTSGPAKHKLTFPSTSAPQSHPPEASGTSEAPTQIIKPGFPSGTQSEVKPIDHRQTQAQVIEQIAQVSGYPPEMLELDMEFSADLGISGERLTAVQTKLAEHFSLPAMSVQLSGNQTVGKAIDQITTALEAESQAAAHPAPSLNAPLSSDSSAKQALTADTLKVFSEVTKYPEDMLELDMEMEADLGIDTVKQATILALLSEKYQLQRDETIQLSNYPTIRALIDLIYERSSLISSALAAAAQPPEPPPAATPLPRSPGQIAADPVSLTKPLNQPTVGQVDAAKEAMIAETLALFSQVTKYPQDMLELDMEMEADLGIDTVKQATILALLSEKYQLDRDETIQLSNYPTIRSLIDLMYARSQAAVAAPERPASDLPVRSNTPTHLTPEIPSASSQATPTWQSSLSRAVPYLAEEPLGTAVFDLRDKHVWILADDGGDVGKARELISHKGAHVQTLVIPRQATAEQLEAMVADFTHDNPVDVIIDCSHVGEAVQFEQLSPTEMQELLFRSSSARFILYKHLSSAKTLPVQVICLTAADGAFGLGLGGPQLSDPTFGSLAGFYKGLRKEWPGCLVRILDLPAHSLEASLELAIAELEHASLGVEIAYLSGKRHIVKLRDEQLSLDTPRTYSNLDTFLISGGGSGIASRLMIGLAQALPVNFIIVDVVPLPDNIAELAALDENGLELLRQDLQAQLQQQGTRVTPAVLNREFSKVTRAVEVYQNLQTVRKLQRQVAYINCDVRNIEQLGAELQRARQQVGPITAIIHAAGIDRSHMLDQKSLAEFEEVFSVKAQGATNLMVLCQDDPLRLAVALSSISGRFGNAAQLDYCAANNFLNDWIKLMQQSRPGLHALSLAWSGWKDVGIAWRNDLVRQRSAETGLNLIDPEQGVAAFLSEIHQPRTAGEVLLHKGLAGFIEPGLADLYLPDYPLIDRITMNEGQIQRAYRVFSIQRDGLIDQHRLGKVPILPAVAYAELAVEYYALQAGCQEQYVLRDVSFTNAFKLFHEQPREIFVEGHPLPGSDSWKIEIKSSFRPPRAELSQEVLHSQAVVSHAPPDLRGLDPLEWSYHTEPATSLPAEQSLLLIQSEGPEQRIILGPLFNDVLRDAHEKEPVLIYPHGTRYPTYFPLEQLKHPKYPLEKLLVNPCFLDSLYQACAANLLVHKKRVYLPYEIGELGIVRVPRQAGMYTCHTQIVEESQDIVSFDVVMLDEAGGICYYARSARFRLINL